MGKNKLNKIMTATVLPPAPATVNERPKNMSMEDYRLARKNYNKAIRDRVKKGFLVHLSQEFLLDEVGNVIGRRFRTGQTFVGNTKFLQVI